MADRTVIVKLVSDASSYITSMGAAAAATKDFGVNAALAAEKHSQSWKTVGAVTAVAGAALVAVGVASIAAAAEFDKAMSTVKANVDDKSVGAMNRLRDAALEAGRTTVFSATQAAEAENELAKAGLSAADIVGGALHASLVLASAGQIDLSSAAEITSSTMTQFGLKAADAAHIADVLSAGADKSLGGVTDLAEGLKYAGVVSSQFGLSLDSTVGILAEFAANGILGSMAGTSLRQMLVQLANPTKAAGEEMSTLGLKFFDANGKFLGMSNLAQELHTKLSGLTDQQREQALVTLFGARSLAEANILYKDGAAGVDKWASAVNDSGFAQQQANEKLNNLSGDLLKLKNSLNAAMIQAGEGAQGPLRDLAQGATNAVNAFANLPAGVQSSILAIAGASGTVLLAVGGFIALSVKIGETVKAFQELQIASKLSFLAGPLGIAIGLAAVAVGIFAKSQMDAAASSKELRDSLDQTTGAVTKQTTALVANRLQADGTAALAAKLGVSFTTVVDAAVNGGAAMDTLTNAQQRQQDSSQTQYTAAVKSGQGFAELTGKTDAFGRTVQTSAQQSQLQAGAFGDLVKAAKGVQDQLGPQIAQQKQLGDAVDGASGAQKAAADAATQNAAALQAQDKAAQDATKANDELLKSLTALSDLTLGARGAERDFAQSIRDATESIRANGKTLDINTDAGSKNQAAIDGIASSALKNVEATFKNRDATSNLGDAVTKAEGQIDAGRAAFIQHATAAGMDQGLFKVGVTAWRWG